MDKLKIILTAVVLLLAAVGAFMLFGLFLAAVKVLLFLGVVLAGAFVFKALKKSDRRQLEEARPERALEDAGRVLEEYKRKQLRK